MLKICRLRHILAISGTRLKIQRMGFGLESNPDVHEKIMDVKVSGADLLPKYSKYAQNKYPEAQG